MQITVFGASGKVGARVVEQATKEGHIVVAFVHRRNPFRGHPKIIVIQGDVRNPWDVERALKGSQAVISCLGSWGRGPSDVQTAAMGVIIPEMHAMHVKRIISLTGADAIAPGQKPEGIHKVMHTFLRVVAGKVLFDGERHINMLAGSGLDWTVLRSPVMNNFGARTHRLTLYPPHPLDTIRRQQVAIAMVNQLKRTKAIGKAPYISRA